MQLHAVYVEFAVVLNMQEFCDSKSRGQGVGEAIVLKQCHALAISKKTLVDIFLRA
jgi:hypothetical protein